MSEDSQFMRRALALAEQAAAMGEVPIGAVVVGPDETIIGEGFNQTISNHDPSAHAEMVAIRQAAQTMQNYRLTGCTLYVTLEPCAMCMGAILHSRIQRVVIAASDPKTGACGSVISLQANKQLNHHCRVTEGVLAQEAKAQLQRFFKERRDAKKARS